MGGGGKHFPLPISGVTPTTGGLRIVLRKKLLIGDCSMDSVARLLGMHRSTLARRLQRHGVHYGELLESVQADLARQLLTDTRMPVQQVAEALQFSNAANFATAFRRWTGATPSEYRRHTPVYTASAER